MLSEATYALRRLLQHPNQEKLRQHVKQQIVVGRSVKPVLFCGGGEPEYRCQRRGNCVCDGGEAINTQGQRPTHERKEKKVSRGSDAPERKEVLGVHLGLGEEANSKMVALK